MAGCAFSDVTGYTHGHHTNAHSADYPSNEKFNNHGRRALNDSANNKYESGNEDGPFSANSIKDEGVENGSKETSNALKGSDERLFGVDG